MGGGSQYPTPSACSLGTSLTNRNAAAVLRDGLSRGAGRGAGRLPRWRRWIRPLSRYCWPCAGPPTRVAALAFVGVPRQLAALAEVYGVDGLLGIPAGAAGFHASHRH